MSSGRMAAAMACVLASCAHGRPQPRASAGPAVARARSKPAADAGQVDGRAAGNVAPGANLLVFVGRKLDVRHVEREAGQFDAEYAVRFEVLEVIYGSYPAREIAFSSFTHTGSLELENHELGLVYVSTYDGHFVQQKYLFQPVYPTVDGRWAGCGDPYARMPDVHRHGVKPEPITFAPPVRFDIRGLSKNNIRSRFPAPWFRHEGDTAICLMGNHAEQLFQVMAEGILEARGVFGPATE